jgi:hypothetical protein
LILETLPDEAWIASRLAPLGYRRGGNIGPHALLVAEPGAAVS